MAKSGRQFQSGAPGIRQAMVPKKVNAALRIGMRHFAMDCCYPGNENQEPGSFICVSMYMFRTATHLPTRTN